MGTSKNRYYSPDATKLPANDSASFPFQFIDVHAAAARDRYRKQFFEVPFILVATFHNLSHSRKHTLSLPAIAKKAAESALPLGGRWGATP